VKLFLERLPITLRDLTDNGPIAALTEHYLGQVAKAEKIDELWGLFFDIATAGIGKFIKLFKISQTMEMIFEIPETVKNSIDVINTVNKNWKTISGENEESEMIYSDYIIELYNENEYDVVTIFWANDTPLQDEIFKNKVKNNILISIPIKVEYEITEGGLIGSYLAVEYKNSGGQDERQSQYFPWQKGITDKVAEEMAKKWKEERPEYPALIDMVYVKGGTFKMGDEVGDLPKECRPAHTVKLTYDYWMGKYAMTFHEYDTFCVATSRSEPDDEGWGQWTRPVMNVSWWDAIGYCNWLSEKEGIAKAYDKDGNLLNIKGKITTDLM